MLINILMQIKTTGKQMEVTEAIEQYLEKKIQSLGKYYENIIKANAVVGMESHHHQKGDIFFAECKMEVPGTNLFAKANAKDVYAAIDLLKDELQLEIKKYKQKARGNEKKKKVVGRIMKEYDPSTEEV